MPKSKTKSKTKSIAIKTDPKLWEQSVKIAKDKFNGIYSARMYQHALYIYKSQGGKFKGKKSKYNSMRVWTEERWRTKSGKPSVHGKDSTGERYLPEGVLRRLSAREYAASSRKKRADSRKGLQYSAEPKTLKPKINKLIKSNRNKHSKSKHSRKKK